ncbi:MAG: EAL domain-containing protein [Hydrogenovibrio sp.]|nr:EAL domain-containing protein [Hydrogenovibrio sp.]
MNKQDFFIGRQPILDRNSQIYGYELLFRGGYDPNEAVFDSAESATAEVIHNSMMGLGLENIVGDGLAFINFPQNFFLDTADPCFSNNRIIIEVLEDVEPTPEVIDGIRALKKQGYTIALDDFIFKKRLIPLIELADIIKFDIQYVKPENIRPLFTKVRQVADVQIIAERVETKEMFNACKEAGADLFQGYYFAKPEVISGKKMELCRQNLMLLLEQIANENVYLGDLIEVVARDVGLTHKLLKMAEQYRSRNMPEFSSLKEVMMLFGLKRVQSWATMLSLSTVDDVMPEVFNIARTRAVFMRSLAKHENLPGVDSFYLAGLFSLLDVIMQQELKAALENLPINDQIKCGICDGKYEYGKLLGIAKQFETATAENVDPDYSKLYFSALSEVNQLQPLI